MSAGATRKGGERLSVFKTIKDLDRGKLAMEIEDAMSEVLNGVLNTGGKGKVEIILDVEMRDGECGAVAVSGDVKFKAPKPAHPAQTHFVMGREIKGGRLSLTRRDPSQPPLEGISGEDSDDLESEPRRRKVELEVIDGKSQSAGERNTETA